MKKVKNDLFDYEDRYIYQFSDGFKFSLDSILLAEYIKIPKKGKLLDMCTGNAPVPLIVSTKYSNHIYGFEIQRDIYDLACESINYNKLCDQITIYNDDVNNIKNYFECESFDAISCNPPYFKDSIVNFNKNHYLTIARHEITINLDNIFQIAAKYLKQNGYFYMVHRPERLDEIIIIANKYRIPVKEIQLITTKDDNIPTVLLIKCLKNGNNGVKFKKIVNVSKAKTYKNLFS